MGEGNRVVPDAGVADEDVELTEGLHGRGDGLLVGRRAGDVALHGHDRAAVVVGPELLDVLGRPVEDDDAGPFLHEAVHHRPSQPRGSAGHDRRLSLEPSHGAASRLS